MNQRTKNLEEEFQAMMMRYNDNSKQLDFYQTIYEVGHDIFVEKITPEEGVRSLVQFSQYMDKLIAIGYETMLNRIPDIYQEVFTMFGKYYPSVLMNNIKMFDKYIHYNDDVMSEENYYENNKEEIKEHDVMSEALNDMCHKDCNNCDTCIDFDSQEISNSLTDQEKGMLIDAAIVDKALEENWTIDELINKYQYYKNLGNSI